MTRLRYLFFPLTLAVASILAQAQGQPKEKPIQVGGGSWQLDVNKAIQLNQGSFEVLHKAGDKHFLGIVYCAPVLTVSASSPDERYLAVSPNVTAKILEDDELGNRLWLGYRLARQHLDYPEQHVAKISVTLDTGEATQDSSGRFPIPKGAKRMERLEIVWAGNDKLPIQKTLVWGRQALPGMSPYNNAGSFGGTITVGSPPATTSWPTWQLVISTVIGVAVLIGGYKLILARSQKPPAPQPQNFPPSLSVIAKPGPVHQKIQQPEKIRAKPSVHIRSGCTSQAILSPALGIVKKRSESNA